MKKAQGRGRQLTEMALFLLVSIGMVALSATAVFADDEAVGEKSYYANPAQAAHAAQLADEAALGDEGVRQSYNDYQEALNALGDEPTEVELAEVAALEEAFQEKLAETTGVLGEDIGAMRASGMGWGEIAHDLGVHPSTLGLGHHKSKNSIADQEIAEATARNTKSGLAKAHETGLKADLGASKQGLGKGNSGKAGDKGSKGDKGDKGNSGGHGGGDGGGHGGGNGGGHGGGNGGGNGGGGGGKM